MTAFEIAKYPVTNGDWLRFVAHGGPVPQFWKRGDDAWQLRLQCSRRFRCRTRGRSTSRTTRPRPTCGGPACACRPRRSIIAPRSARRRATSEPFPWGAEEPSPRRGNFDFARFDPEPVDAHPAGESAWGVADLIGNGWEWTSTPFAPLPGFAPMASYPQYSADFFDGRHYVMKGASPVTPRELIRRSFRNWFFDDYPYMYAKFRCVEAR